MEKNEHMKIAELANLSGVSASTIRFYAREGLLPSPIKTRKTMAYYTRKHLERLSFIREKQVNENLPLHFIKEMIAREFQGQKGQQSEIPFTNTDKKEDIIQAAIRIFREKGYADTSIADIVTDAAIGRGTFYLFFKNKDEIFIECADRLFFELYQGVWKEIKDEKDMLVRLRKRAWSFLASYPKWADAMNLLRGASVSQNPAFQEKLRQIMKQIINPIIRDIEKAVKQGKLRPIDSTIAGYLVMGVMEYCAYLHEHGRCNEIDLFNAMTDLLTEGLKQRT